MNSALVRLSALAALALVSTGSGWAADKKARLFNAHYDVVWAAADEVSKQAFLQDHSSKPDGQLRFRAGPFRGYRFNVAVIDSGSGKTRVELELRTNLRGIEKDAWRNGERYFDLVSRKLARPAEAPQAMRSGKPK